jgi:hypothetical protein
MATRGRQYRKNTENTDVEEEKLESNANKGLVAGPSLVTHLSYTYEIHNIIWFCIVQTNGVEFDWECLG